MFSNDAVDAPRRARGPRTAATMSACLGACCGACAASACRGCFARGRTRERRDGAKDGDVERGDDDSGAPRDVGDASWRRKYAGAFVALAFATWALRDGRGASSRLGKAFGWACRDALAARSCAHETAVRVGLGNSLFFAFMLVVTFMVKESDRTSARVRFNEGFWLVKGVIWLGLLVAAFAVTLNDYSGLVNVDRFFAAVFLLIQLIVLLGWVYDLNDKLMSGMDEGGNRSFALLLTSSAATYAFAFTLVGFLYKLWAPSSECHRNIALITCMLIVCVIFSVISLHARVNGGLFTSGAMTFYCMYVLASALASEPNNYACTPASKDGDLSSILSVIGFVFALFALGVTAHSASSKSAFAGEGAEGSEDPTSTFNVTFFHFVFFTASSYCAMTFTEWTNGRSAAGWESAWAKVAAAYASAALYTWALLAPFVLRNREFR